MDDQQDKKAYEIGFIAKAEDGAEVVLKALKDSGATIDLEGQVSKLLLSYPIKKTSEGYFGYFHFSLEPGKLADAENSLRINPAIPRFLIVTPPFAKQKPRAFFPQRRRAVPAAPVGTERKSSFPQALSNEALEQQLKQMQ